jgi:hypothetical protein
MSRPRRKSEAVFVDLGSRIAADLGNRVTPDLGNRIAAGLGSRIVVDLVTKVFTVFLCGLWKFDIYYLIYGNGPVNGRFRAFLCKQQKTFPTKKAQKNLKTIQGGRPASGR